MATRCNSIGVVSGSLAANALAQLGVLAPEFRPRASKLLVAAVMGGALTYGFAQIQVNQTGELYIRPGIAMELASINVSWPLD
jgi:hypothetical protein